MKNEEVFNLIEETLGLPSGTINIESDNKNVSGWDSLGHFAILVALDGKYNDVSINKPEITKATSLKEILAILSRDD